ncbi:MAG TPA: recombinase family protein, partial [Steroidobacteraceae bacterium]|nr:recombinase family protein [Steroidobacteraceae bacterium]
MLKPLFPIEGLAMTPKATPAGPARAYSYLRFSRPEQAQGDSLRRQTSMAAEYAARHGLNLDSELNLRDLGVSAFRGANATVGALGGFLKAITDGLVPPGSLLLVEALDRVSRQSARQAVRRLEEIIEAGVDVVTLSDGKRWTQESLDGYDFLLAILLFMRGHEESATKSRRLKAAWSAKRERAARLEIQTRCVPAWVRHDGKKLALIPDRAALIRRIFRMFLRGVGKIGIATALNREGVEPWGCTTGRRPAAHWHTSYLLKILRNPAVVGTYIPHVVEHKDGRVARVPQPPIPGYYPRVVDDETFERAQTLLTARAHTVRQTNVRNLVGGLARCPKCGATMTRVTKGSKPSKAGHPKLVCVTAKAGAGCKYHAVVAPDVERALVDSAD